MMLNFDDYLGEQQEQAVFPCSGFCHFIFFSLKVGEGLPFSHRWCLLGGEL